MYKFKFPIKAITKDNFKCQNRQGRYFLKQEFKDFEAALRGYALSQIPLGFKKFEKEDLFVGLTYSFKDHRHADLSNLPKSTLDAFKGILWKDDRQVHGMTLDMCYGQEFIAMELSLL